MKRIIIICLLIINGFIASSQTDTLTQDDIKFAARYIVYLEKKDAISQEIIQTYFIKDSLELKLYNELISIDSIQSIQLDKFEKILTPVSKPKWYSYILPIAIGYFIGRGL